MIRPEIPTLALAAALFAGCGGDQRDAAEAASPPTPASAVVTEARTTVDAPAPRQTSTARRGTTIKAVSSQFGKILADGRGQAVYAFDKETSSSPRCYGACAKAWPPVLTKGSPVAGKGARRGLLGTTRRRNGKRQVTVDRQPVYYYVDDAPRRVLCHNVDEFGGRWLVVRPDGTPVP